MTLPTGEASTMLSIVGTIRSVLTMIIDFVITVITFPLRLLRQIVR